MSKADAEQPAPKPRRKPVVRRNDDKPFSPSRRAGEHRAAAKSASSRRTGGSSRRARQDSLPFDGAPSLIARLRPQRFMQKMLQLGIGVLGILLLVAVVMATYMLSHGIRLFAPRAIEIEGATIVSQETIKKSIEPMLDKGVLLADLVKMREMLLKNELISNAAVTRMLPDTIRVTVIERIPVGLTRRANNDLACVDAEGYLFGDEKLIKKGPIPPLISGLREEESNEARAFNRQRLEACRTLIAELDSSEPHLSGRIDEVYYDDVEGIRVILTDSRIAVYLGKENYRQRLNSALDILDAAERRDLQFLNLLHVEDAARMIDGSRVAYLNTRIPRRVIVGFK